VACWDMSVNFLCLLLSSGYPLLCLAVGFVEMVTNRIEKGRGEKKVPSWEELDHAAEDTAHSKYTGPEN